MKSLTLPRWRRLVVVATAFLACGPPGAPAPPPGPVPSPGPTPPPEAEAIPDPHESAGEWTRAFQVDDLQGVMAALFREVDTPGLDDAIDRIERVSRDLAPGDRVIFSVLVAAEGEVETIELEILEDFGLFLRIRGTGAPYRRVRSVAEEFWRASLLETGPLRLSFREFSWPRGSPPRLRLVVSTVREVGCQPSGLPLEFERAGDTLDLELFGVAPSRGLCWGSGPAYGEVELDVPPGTYRLVVRKDDRTDSYELRLSDQSVQLDGGADASFTGADTRLHLRYPPNSFAIACETGETRAQLCDRFHAWVASRKGISLLEFPVGGVVPFRLADPPSRAYFTYEDEAAVQRVRRCFADLESRLVGLSRIGLRLQTWTGESISTWSDNLGRRPDRAGVPSPHDNAEPGAQLPCLASVPPPDVDSLGPGPSAPSYFDGRAVERGFVKAADVWPCEVERSTPEFGVSRTREELLEDEGPKRVAPGLVLPDPWRDAERKAALEPVVLPGNTSRSAVERERMHRDLRTWLCRGGIAVGKASTHAGAPWYWVEAEGFWYFLLPATTSGAVRRYLDLVDEAGGDIGWAVADGQHAGPQRVAVGAARLEIPDFHLYRWRP